MARSANDLAALKRREQLGHGPPGTYARIVAEEAGLPPPAAPKGQDPHETLLELATRVSSPEATKKRIHELKVAEDKHKAASEKAQADITRAAKVLAENKAEITRELQDCDERIAAKTAAHEAKMKADTAALAAKAKALADERAAFEAERSRWRERAAEMQQHLRESAA